MKNTRKSVSTLLMGLLLFGTVLLTGTSVRTYAESLKNYGPQNKETIFFTKEMKQNEYDWGYGFPKGTKISNVKTSNKSVATAKAETWKNGSESGTELNIDLRKTGKVTISFTAKLGKQKRNYKTVLTVKNYKCPVTSFKIGGKEYVSKYKDVRYYNVKKKISGKLVIKPASGWRISSISLDNYKTGKWKTIKNNQNVTLKLQTGVFVNFVNRSNEYMGLSLNCWK